VIINDNVNFHSAQEGQKNVGDFILYWVVKFQKKVLKGSFLYFKINTKLNFQFKCKFDCENHNPFNIFI